MVPNDKLGQIGKPVKFRYGPAAVIGDQRRNMSLSDLLSEACEKCSIFTKFKESEDFYRRHTNSISRIKI
jgi:hypothetical protein